MARARNWMEYGMLAGRKRLKLDEVRANLAPLLDYIAKDWLGPVAGNHRRPKTFVTLSEGGNRGHGHRERTGERILLG